MAFDPNLPANHAPIIAVELRDQFNALDAKIGECATQAGLTDAINAGAAGNCDGVAELNLTVSNPPTQAQMQALADKQDELIRALKRM